MEREERVVLMGESTRRIEYPVMWGRYYLASLYKHRKWGSEGWGESLNHRADQWQNQHSPCLQEPTDWKRLWCWERVRAGGEGDDRWWDGWMASPTRWTWVWASSGSWWWTGKSGVAESDTTVTELKSPTAIQKCEVKVEASDIFWYLWGIFFKNCPKWPHI